MVHTPTILRLVIRPVQLVALRARLGSLDDTKPGMSLAERAIAYPRSAVGFFLGSDIYAGYRGD